MSVECMTPGCRMRRAELAGSGRGLCLTCYSKAKKLVASGQTTWEYLEKVGLTEKGTVGDPFTEAFNKTKE